MEVTKEQAQAITAELKAAVEEVLGRHGLVASNATKTGYGDNYSFKVEAFRKREGRNGVNLASKEAKFFEFVGATHGLTNDDLGAVITLKGEKWTLTGARDSGKFPFIAIRNKTGKVHGLPESDDVVAAIKAVRA
jgi:hypothetical protein